jgi:orotate phosphoribosyltransferase
MEYRSVADLNQRITDWVHVLPRDLDVVAGVPRSGMLAANLLALHLNLPLTDVEGLARGSVMHAGSRYGGPPADQILGKPSTVLVLDDSCCSGASLARVRERLARAGLPHRLHFAAVYATPEAVREGRVDLFAEAVPVPRLFEWNIMHTPLMSTFCVDIDGVLCRDPAPEVNDDGPHYSRFLHAAEPLVLPRYEIGWLVTSRLEKYREQTEDWLRRHGVRYRELIMMQYPDMRARQAARAYGRFKADAYLETGAALFVESAPHTAAEVARLSGKPVFCTDTREMLYPGGYPRARHIPVRPRHPVEKALRWTARLPRRVLRKAVRTLSGTPADSGAGRSPAEADPIGHEPIGSSSR